MRNKGGVILVSLVVLTVGYAVYDYQSEKKNQKVEAEHNLVLKLDKDQIAELGFMKDQDPGFSLERTNEGWKIKTPIQETADQAAVQDYLDGVALEHTHEVVKQGAGIDWSIYGLDRPAGMLSFKANTGPAVIVDVSAKKNYSGDSYIRLQGEEKVLLAGSTWLSKLNKRLIDFRDKRILRKAAALIQSFTYKSDKENFTLIKKEDHWIAPEKPEWKLDPTRSSELIYMLNTASAIEFSKEGDATPAELKAFGLNHPKFSIEVTLRDAEPAASKWRVLFASNDKKEYYAQTFVPPRILKISTGDMAKFSKMSLSEFRDRHEPFDFDKTHVKKMHIVNGSLTADFVLKDEEWTVENEDKKLDYQLDRPKAVLALIRNLEVSDFNPEASAGQPLDQSVQFIDEQGKVIYEVHFTKTYRRTKDEMVKAYVLAKTSAYPQAVGVDEGTFRSIAIDAIVKKKDDAVKPAEKKAGEK